jgi:hypothetical protein
MRAFLFRVELDRFVPVDRLQRAHPGEHHRAVRALYAQLDWSANLGSSPLPVLQLQPKI